MAGLIEAVPNFSEGVRTEVLDALVNVVRSVDGAFLLDRTSDRDHNRSVLTIAGSLPAVEEAGIRLVGEAATRIDLTEHRGVHPRMGACDVLPFVPLDGTTMDECVAVAHRVGNEIWKRYHVPAYFYESAALTLERKKLEDVRRGGFENPSLSPDIGTHHRTAGATIVGARKFLIAYNVNLRTPDVEVAKMIARKVRTSSGGLPCVKALGLELSFRRQAQVSLNLTDFEATSVDDIYRAVEKEALSAGVEIAGSELIGLIPQRALPKIDVKWENFDPSKVLETRLAVAKS